MLGYPPIVSGRVLDPGRTIAIELVSRLLNRAGARFKRTLERQVYIFEINLQMDCGCAVFWSGVCHHDDGIAEGEFGVCNTTIGSID